MSNNPYSDIPPNPYAAPADARFASNDAARLAVKLKVQPVTIVLMVLSVFNLPVMIYVLILHFLLFRDDLTYLVQLLAIDASIILTTLVMIYGANEFRRLRNRSAARIAVILACIPFCSPCMVIGIPVGIWGLIVLGQDDVREAFEP